MPEALAVDSQTPPAVLGCIEACRRCGVLVDAIARTDAAAARVFAVVGPHLRHCLDHFTCLLRGLDVGLVDYDARDRDEVLEREPDRAVALLATLVERLRSIGASQLEQPLSVLQEAAPGCPSHAVTSCLERELLFLSSHTIHHLAIMSLLARQEGAGVPPGLGIAFSTASWKGPRVSSVKT